MVLSQSLGYLWLKLPNDDGGGGRDDFDGDFVGDDVGNGVYDDGNRKLKQRRRL